MKPKTIFFFSIFFTFLILFNSVFAPILQVAKVFAEEFSLDPQFSLTVKASDPLQGGHSQVSATLKNTDTTKLVNFGVTMDLPTGFSFGGSTTEQGQPCEESCPNPEIVGNQLIFRSIADLLPNESKTLYWKINVPSNIEIGSTVLLNYQAHASKEDDLSQPHYISAQSSFQVLPYTVELITDTTNLVGETIKNEIIITSNPTTDSAIIQTPLSYPEQDLTPQPISFPQEEPVSFPIFDFEVPPMIVEVLLGEGEEYVLNSQRVENYDPARIIFDYFNQAIDSIATVLKWTFLDGLTTQNTSTNPIKIFFDTIARDIGHNQKSDKSLRVSAVYNDHSSQSVEYTVEKNSNLEIGYFNIQKNCTPSRIDIEDTALCKILIKTSKEHSLKNLNITDELPNGVEFLSWTNHPIVSLVHNGSTLSWSVNELAKDSQLEFQYEVRLLTQYQDLSQILTSDNFKSFTTLNTDWENTDGVEGSDIDATQSQISTLRPQFNFKFNTNTKQIHAKIGDVLEIEGEVSFPKTPTKQFELTIYAPIGTKIINYEQDPIQCELGCEQIKFETSDISPQTKLAFNYSIQILDDARLDYTSIIRNLIRANYSNSANQKISYLDELVINIVEPKVEVSSTLSGVLARGEEVELIAKFQNTGQAAAYELKLQQFIPQNTTLSSTQPIIITSNYEREIEFTYNYEAYETNSITLLPAETIELRFHISIDDVNFGTSLYSKTSTSTYTNHEEEIVGKRTYQPSKYERFDRAGEPMIVTNIVSTRGSELARGEVTTLTFSIKEVGRGIVYELNKVIQFLVDGQEVTLEQALNLGFKIQNITSATPSTLQPNQTITSVYEVSVLQGTPYGRELSANLKADGLNALENEVRKDGSEQNHLDIDPLDQKTINIAVVKKDFVAPYGEIKFFNQDNEETGFTNQEKIKLQLIAGDNLGIETISIPENGIEVYDNLGNVATFNKIQIFNDQIYITYDGDTNEYDFESNEFQNEFFQIQRYNNGQVVLTLNLVDTHKIHSFQITDWNENQTNISKQIEYDVDAPTLAWLTLSPRSDFPDIAWTTSKFNYAHFGLTDNNPGGYYRYSLDGINFTSWSFLTSGNNVLGIDFTSQDSNELEVFFQFKDLAGNFYPATLRASVVQTNQPLVLDWNFTKQYTSVNFAPVEITVFNPTDNTNISKDIWISSGDAPSDLSNQSFLSYLPQYMQIQTGSTGVKQLCLQVTAVTTQSSNTLCRNIVYDVLAPSGEAWFDHESIEFNAIDPQQEDGTPGSNVYVRFRLNSDWSSWMSASQSFSTGTLAINPGTNYLYYQFRDEAGNTSEIKSITYNFNPTSNSRISINDGAYFTDTSKVKVNLNPAKNLANQLPSLFRIKQIYIPNEIARNTQTQESIIGTVEADWSGWSVFTPQFDWRLTNAFFENLSTTSNPNYSFGKYILHVEYMYPDTTKSAVPDQASIIYTPVYASILQIDGSIPTEAKTAEVFNYNLNVKNAGSLTWQKANEAVTNPVRIVYRWKNIQENLSGGWGSIVDFLPMHFRGGEFELPSDIFYDQGFSIPIQLRAPDILGLYELEIDLVHEGITYFGDLANPTIKQTINITQNPELPIITAGINPETGEPFNFNLPEGAGAYYAGQVIVIRGIWEKAPPGSWWHYHVWEGGINYKFVDISFGNAYLGKRVEVVAIGTGVSWNYTFHSIKEIEPTFSASLHQRGFPQTLIVNRGQTGVLFYQFLNTGSVDAKWNQSSTALRHHSGDASFGPWQKLIDQGIVNPGSIASVRYPFTVPSNKPFGNYQTCFTFLTTYNGDKQLLTDCITFKVQPTEAEQRQITCAQPQNVYQQPSTTSVVLGTLNQHDSFIHTRTFGNFLEIFYGASGTQVGYLENSLSCFTAGVSVPNPIIISEIPEPPARPTGDQGYVMKLDGINVLHGPSELFPSKCTIDFNQEVKILGEVDFNTYSVGWLKIQGTSTTGQTCEGWVSKGYIDYEGVQKKLNVSITPEYGYAHVCSGGHAIHTGPGYEFPRTGLSVGRNQNIEIRQEWNAWVHIGSGWIPKNILCRGYYVPPQIPVFTGSVAGEAIFEGILFERPIKDYYVFTSGFYDLRVNTDGSTYRHSGSDYAAPCGTPVYAAASGVVSRVRKGSTIGGDNPAFWDKANLVYIDHPNGSRTTYVHLKDVYVNLGDRVSMGQIIGTVGTTGYSTGCHLHFEIRANHSWASAVDPEEIFSLSKSAGIPALSILRRQSQLYDYTVVDNDLGTIHEVCGTFVKDYSRIQTTSNDGWASYGNIFYNPDNEQSYVLRGGLRHAYWTQNGCNLIRYPVSEEAWGARSPQGTTGAYQVFQKGQIYSSNKGSYVVSGNIWKLHESLGEQDPDLDILLVYDI